jgi:hypothetical protein
VTIETKVAGVEDAVLLGVGEAGDGGGAGVTDEVGVDEGPPGEAAVVAAVQEGPGALALGGVEEEEA